jgi:iron complex outermembrane recepter protein
MKRTAFFIATMTALQAAAQEKWDTTELTPVEVKAVRANATAPFAKTNLYRKDITKQNLGQDLPFLLNQTPSVVVNSDAGNGVGYTGIRIRGTDATRINLTLNGIPYNDAESQGIFFVNLPDFVSSVNSIQIQRGVGTSTNGAGAFGATVNLSTNEVNKKAYGELNNSFGSFNTWKNTVRFGTGLLDDHFTVDARLSRITSNGYIDRATSDLRSGFISAAYLSNTTNFRLNVFSGKEKTYQAWYGVSETDLKNNRTINYAGMEKPGEPYDNETDNYRQDHYQFFFDQKLGKTWTFNTALFLTEGKGYYEQYKADRKYSDYGMPDLPTASRTDLIRQLWLDNDFYGNIFSLQHQTPKTSLIIGGGWTKYDGTHFGKLIWAEKGLTGNPVWYNLDAVKKDLNVYTKWQQQLSTRLQSFIDLQLRKVDYGIEGFRDNPDLPVNTSYNFFNPKFGLTYSWNGLQAYASYSIGHKEPNRDDFEAGAEQQPRPEELRDVEIGVEQKRKNYNWSANVYYMKYKDQLVLTGKINDVGAYTRTNIDDSYRLGVELSAGAFINRYVRLTGNIALSRNKIKNFTEFIDDYDNGGQKENFFNETDISFSPNVVGAATVTVLPFKSFSVDLLSKYVGKQYLDNTSNESRKLNDYYVQDIRAIYSFNRKWLKNADVILQVNNVFNKKYEPNGYTFSYFANNELTSENYYFPMAGTNWMLGLNLQF